MTPRVAARAIAGLTATIVLAVAGCSIDQQPAVSPSQSTTASVTPSPTGPTPSPTSTPTPSAVDSGSASAVPSVTPSASPAPTSRPAASATRTSTTTRPSSTRPAPAPTTTTARPSPTGCAIPSSLRGKDLTSIPTTRKVIALTFDGGASAEGAQRILATLADKGVPASFFLTGDFADAYPATARRIAAAHPVGNHTQNHPDLTTQSDATVRTEIAEGARSIREATGQAVKPWFRFPFGAVDAHRIALVNQACYVPFRWTTDTLGWKGTSEGQSVASVTRRVLDGARPGGIVLMHLGANPRDRSTLDADALPGIIDGLRARGYTFVTLSAVW